MVSASLLYLSGTRLSLQTDGYQFNADPSYYQTEKAREVRLPLSEEEYSPREAAIIFAAMESTYGKIAISC